MKPYQQIPVQDCREQLVPIPGDLFVLAQPHPYQRLGAPYGDKSPFYVREDVLTRLGMAQKQLHAMQPGWKIFIFDAFRPLVVQQFMVDYTFAEVVSQQGFNPENLTDSQRQHCLEQVYEFWAAPNSDPAYPPPHSTGAAIDITLVNEAGDLVNMGSPIDEISPRSYPNHFAESQDSQEQEFHQYRELLNHVMTIAGFMRHQGEWWHFSYGDQMWAWLKQQVDPGFAAIARYGRVE